MSRPAPDPRKYEMMILVAPTVTEEGLPPVVERVSGYVTDQGGEVESLTHDSPWGRRRLAYPIQRFQDAFYVLYYFYAPPASIDELERALRLDDQVIRHLVVRYDPLTEREGEAAPFDGVDGDAAVDAAEEPSEEGTSEVTAEAETEEPSEESASEVAAEAETEEPEESSAEVEETASEAEEAEEDVPSDDDSEESK